MNNTGTVVVNFDELIALLKRYFNDEGINVNLNGLQLSTNQIEQLLKNIQNDIEDVKFDNLLDALNKLGAKIDTLGNAMGWNGIQKVYGNVLEIPATINKKDKDNGTTEEEKIKHTIEFKAPCDGKITGISYSQSSWRYEDNWDLVVSSHGLFEKVTTKQYGEHIKFATYYPIKKDKIIKFIYNNNSKSSKVVWVDFFILEESQDGTM